MDEGYIVCKVYDSKTGECVDERNFENFAELGYYLDLNYFNVPKYRLEVRFTS